jgi:hypothetical protein
LGAGARKGLSSLVTTLFRKPTTPTAGAATWTVGAAGVVTAAVVAAAVSALLEVLAAMVFAVDTSLDSVSFADDCVTVVDGTLVAGESVVVSMLASDLVDFDPLFAGVDACSGSAAGVAGGVLGSVGAAASPEPAGSLDFGGVSTTLGVVDASGSVVLV